MGFPKSFRTVEIEQKCSYGWTAENVQKFLDGWPPVKDYAFIVHDKDVKADGSLKDAHVHCMMRFKEAVPTISILQRAKVVFNSDSVVKLENLERCKKWDSAVAYLTHSNAQDKHRYDDAEIISNYEWTVDRDSAINPIKDKRLNEIIGYIDSEKMRKYNYMEYVSAQEYVKYKKSIDDAFKYVNDRNISKGVVKNMKCMYLTGDSGTGKTYYARNFCEEHNLSYFVSSGSNDILDGYGGQDAIILDDLRPSCLGLSDLLKLLDNNTSSTIKSRYYNKSISYCKYIIITTVCDIETFFNQVFKEEKEPIIQLKRRCATYMQFYVDSIKIHRWNDKNRDYEFVTSVPNVILEQFKEDEMTPEKAENLLNDLFVGMKGMAQYAVKHEQTLNDEFMNVESGACPFLDD